MFFLNPLWKRWTGFDNVCKLIQLQLDSNTETCPSLTAAGQCPWRVCSDVFLLVSNNYFVLFCPVAFFFQVNTTTPFDGSENDQPRWIQRHLCADIWYSVVCMTPRACMRAWYRGILLMRCLLGDFLPDLDQGLDSVRCDLGISDGPKHHLLEVFCWILGSVGASQWYQSFILQELSAYSCRMSPGIAVDLLQILYHLLHVRRVNLLSSVKTTGHQWWIFQFWYSVVFWS